MYKIKKNTIQSLLDYQIVLLLLFSSGTCYTSLHQPIVFMCVLCVLIMMFFVKLHGRVSGKKFLLFIFLGLLNILTALFNVDSDFISYLGLFITCLIGFLSSNLISKERFYQIFLNIIFYFCIFSLIMYAISNINRNFVLQFPVSSYNNVYSVYGLHIFLGIYNSDIIRNSGPFREPGMFAVYLLFALILVLYQENCKRRMIKLLFIISTMITTRSSSGCIAMVVLFGGYFFYHDFSKNQKYVHIKCIVMLTLVGTILLIFIEPSLLLDKLNSTNYSYMSFQSRHNGTMRDYSIWLDNPFFGHGITKYEALSIGTANSLSNVLAIFGIIFALIEIMCVWLFIKGIVSKSKGEITWFFIAGSMLVVFYTQSILFFPFIQTMLFFEASNFTMDSVSLKKYEKNSNN